MDAMFPPMTPGQGRRRGLAATALAAVLLLTAFGAAEGRAPSSQKYETAITPFGNYLAAVVAGNARDIDAEAQFLREALAMDPSNADMQQQALYAYLANGDIKDAQVVSQRILRGSPSKELALLSRSTLAIGAIRERRFREAFRILEEAGPEAQKDPTVAVLQAWSKLGSGRPKEALGALERIQSGVTGPLADYMRGLMGVVVRDRALAAANLQKSYQRNPQEIRTADAFARFLAGRGDRAAALKIYEDIDRRIPGMVLIADPLQMLREGKTPPPLVESSVQGAAELFFILSDVGDPSPGGRMRETIYLQFATFLDPDDPVYITALGQSLDASGQPQRAYDVYSEVKAGTALREAADIRRVQALQRLEKPEEALALLETLIKAHPQDVDYLRTAALLHSSQKRWTDAISYFDRAIAAAGTITVDNWDLLYRRGIAYERSKNWPPAEADFKRVLEILPAAKPGQPFARERAQVLNYLAYTWVDRHENIDPAFAMLKEAVALTNGQDGYIVDSLGWAHYRLGQYELAVRELEKAVELKPGDPVVNDHLGDAYWKVGRKLEAGFKWNHATSLDPEPEDLKRIQEKIKNGLVDAPKAAQTGKQGDGG